MKEAKLCLPAATDKGLQFTCSFQPARGRKKRVKLKIPLRGREGAGNLLIIRMIKLGIGPARKWTWAKCSLL